MSFWLQTNKAILRLIAFTKLNFYCELVKAIILKITLDFHGANLISTLESLSVVQWLCAVVEYSGRVKWQSAVVECSALCEKHWWNRHSECAILQGTFRAILLSFSFLLQSTFNPPLIFWSAYFGEYLITDWDLTEIFVWLKYHT